MAADVEKGMHAAAAIANHQYRVLAHIGGQEIAGLGNLAVMAQKQPASREELPQLLFVNLRLDKNAATDQPAIGINEAGEFACHPAPPSLVTATAPRATS